MTCIATIDRSTSEIQVNITVSLDGSGLAQLATGVPFTGSPILSTTTIPPQAVKLRAVQDKALACRSKQC